MFQRSLRVLPLLLVCSFAPAALAQSADLSVAIKTPISTLTPDSVSLGIGITYTITNAGPDPAKDVTLATNIRYTYVTFPPAFEKCSLGTNGTTCTASSLPPGSYQIQFTVFTQVYASGPYPISASVSSSTGEPDLSNNSSSTSIAVVFKSDLEIGFSAPDAFARAGGPLQTHVSWYTNGPSAVEDLTVVVDVPPGFKPSGQRLTDFPSNGNCQFPADFNGGQIVCHFGTQEYGGNITFFGTTADTLAPGTRLDFKSTVSSPADTSAGNDTDHGSAVIVGPTDLQVTLDAGRNDQGSMGARVTLRNTSAVEAEVPLLEIAFNGQQAIDRKAPTGWKCGTYTLNIPGVHTGCRGVSLPAGASATLEFSGQIPYGSTSSTVEVIATSINAESTPSNNHVLETASFTGATDWAVQISAPASAPFATDVTVNVTAKRVDAGPSGAQVMYTVPAGADLTSYPSGVCKVVPGTSPVVIECGADKETTFPFVIRPKTPGTYLHRASVNVWAAATPADPDVSNNGTVSKTEVENPWAADLTVSLVASPTGPVRGQPVTYTVAVTNSGGEAATSVTITDTLPPSLVLSSAPDTCTSANSTLTCTFPSLAPAEMRTLSFTAIPLTPGEIVDTVSLGNKTATATIEVSSPRGRSVRH
jgi:uncharacterized repeat protein (TIGR01451 family)